MSTVGIGIRHAGRSQQVNSAVESRDVSCTMGTVNEPRYDVVWPQAPMGVQRHRHAARLDDLRGKTVAFVWEYMFRGDELFPVLEQYLRDTYDVEVVGYEAFGNTHGPDEAAVLAELPHKLRDWRVDAAVSGVGC